MSDNDIIYAALPMRAREIANVIGLGGLEKLVRWRGGIAVYVPATLPPGHMLARRLGRDAAQQLVDHYPAGTHLVVPKCEAAVRALLHQQIGRRRDAGESEAAVARDIGMYCRSVRRIYADYKAGRPEPRAEHKPQQDLFTDA